MTSALRHRVPDDRATGWRYWHVEQGLLRSVSQRRFRWPTDEAMRAVCVTGGHDPPVTRCGCGIYAAHDLGSLRARRMCLDPAPLVVGEVALWGPVVRSDDGMRARYAYPRRLLAVEGTTPRVPQEDVESALRAYGVPVGTIPLGDAVDDVSARLIDFQVMSGGPPG